MRREAAAYEHTDWSLESLVARAYHMARAGAAVSRYAADCFPDTEAARLIHKAAARVEAALDGWDLTAEDAFDMAGQPPPPELSRKQSARRERLTARGETVWLETNT